MDSTQSRFSHPDLTLSAALLTRHFSTDYARRRRPLRNPHPETPVSAAAAADAIPSAVLMLFVPQEQELALIVTRRSAKIRFGGHICFPGGKVDGSDADIEATALREAQEEIGLNPAAVTVLGRLGDYVTQSGYRISPVGAMAQQPLSIERDLQAEPDEVAAIYALAANRVFTSDAYRLQHFGSHGHYAFHDEPSSDNIRIAGPTVSIMIGLYEEVLKSQGLLDSGEQTQAITR
jgi:8-oxo-dGTP pyrophosphatase MutT (NUDIX family)